MDVAGDVRHLSFLLFGNRRSGSHSLARALDHSGLAKCHFAVIDGDQKDRESAHYDYFGSCPHSPPWGDMQPSLERYIAETLLEKPQRREIAVGVHLMDNVLATYDMFSAVSHWTRQSDLVSVRVVRNPVSSFLSFKQAEQQHIRRRPAAWTFQSGLPVSRPLPLRIDPEEMIPAVAQQMACDVRLSESINGQCFHLHYEDLVLSWWETMGKLFHFLELPAALVPPPAFRRQPNRHMRLRCLNWDELKKATRGEMQDLVIQAEQEDF